MPAWTSGPDFLIYRWLARCFYACLCWYISVPEQGVEGMTGNKPILYHVPPVD